ncbi:cadherin-3-like, partial [Limulus polyphemus]|uniref:Cadherin-3-like n=1 Tax=Limulus polyphemus TaxID=6850 RepID=A0ABM1TER2_LIMPO
MANKNVLWVHMANNNVLWVHMANNNVLWVHMANKNVLWVHMANNNVFWVHMANNNVFWVHMANNNVLWVHMANKNVLWVHMANKNVLWVHMANNNVFWAYIFNKNVLGVLNNEVMYDNRCYLTSGGSSEIFTINEALPVDSILGRIQVNGNAGNDGDIVLSLDGDNLPISIEPYTKNLILRQKLDKEGLEGVQTISVDVSCSKTGVEDPSIIIPVRIIVTDANDNGPRFIGSPYTLNISEITVVGTVVMQDIKAVDDDQAGLFNTVEYFIERGPYSHLLAFDNRLEGILILNSPLDFETLPKFSVKIRAQ